MVVQLKQELAVFSVKAVVCWTLRWLVASRLFTFEQVEEVYCIVLEHLSLLVLNQVLAEVLKAL